MQPAQFPHQRIAVTWEAELAVERGASAEGSGRIAAPHAVLPRRRVVVALAGFSAISAIGGGAALILGRDGSALLPIRMIAHTPFTSFLVPGLLLAIVIGGTSAACAILATRRSPAAVDATLLAGGALTVWILAEAAMMREVHWLHLMYGALGLALLGLGVHAAWRSRLPRHRWVITVTGAEAAGYLAPACAGILSARAGLDDVSQAALVVAAGLIEGTALGAGQAWAMPIAVRRGRYALWTALAAAVVWASVLAMMHGIGGVPGVVGVGAAIITGVVGLGAIGGAQWLELRHHVLAARRWIAWTALAWILALPLSFAPGPFVDPSTPLASHLVLWGCGGLLMAHVMAHVTWQGMRRLRSPVAQRAR